MNEQYNTPKFRRNETLLTVGERSVTYGYQERSVTYGDRKTEYKPKTEKI
jgi:hypothetical protein